MRSIRWLLPALALAAMFARDAGAQNPAGTVPLKLFWSEARRDNFTTATAQGERDALAAGYGFSRVEAYVYAEPRTGTVPLKLFWSAARGDNFTTATAIGESHALAAGYTFARVEGYIFPTPQNGTVPLKLYWSDERRDNFTTATAIGESHALAAKYRLARIEGYVYPAQPATKPLPPLPPLEKASTPTPPSGTVVASVPSESSSRATSGAPAPAAATPSPPGPAAPVIAALPPAAEAKAQGKRVALVIGNSAYAAVSRLPNPGRDAAAVAAALQRVGFDSVVVANDLTREGLVSALIAFGREADKADWGLVYYAGHGVEIGGVNYLVPIDARLANDRDVELEAVSLNQVLGAVERARKLRLVLLDACRDNPFVQQMKRTLGTRSVGRGLASVEPEAGTLVVYAAKHGETALDGDDNNSPFATALVKNLVTPGVEVRRMFDFVRDEVLEVTRRRQQPYSYGSLPGREDYYFAVK